MIPILQGFQQKYSRYVKTANIEIKQVPFKQRLELMTALDYDIVFAGWGPDYDDPLTYLDLWVIGGGNND